MKLPFGLQLTRQKAAVAPTDLSPTVGGGWVPFLHDQFGGAWQRSIRVDKETALTFPALYSVVTLIASDVSKLGIRLVEKTASGTWQETQSPAYSPVLRKPNRFQNHVQFREHWLLSKLTYGNTYVLKVRDDRNVVVALYVLDPRHVQPFVSPGAAVFYRLQADNLSTIGEAVMVPASEIIHDRMNPIHHPLVGCSPITACGLASQQGLEILRTSTKFFENNAQPGGLLTAPGQISAETAARLKQSWEANFSGDKVGKVAVLGDGLAYQSMSITPVDAQLIQQLNMSEKMVCTAYHVPGYKIGVGETPKYENAQVLNQIYYSDCLQKLIEDFEACIDEGLRLPAYLGVELNIDDLLKMDAQTQITFLKEAVGAKIMKPNEARKRLNLEPTAGGDSLWGQQQDHSLEALARRDAMMTPDGALIPEDEEENETEETPLALPAPEPERSLNPSRLAALLEKAL